MQVVLNTILVIWGSDFRSDLDSGNDRIRYICSLFLFTVYLSIWCVESKYPRLEYVGQVVYAFKVNLYFTDLEIRMPRLCDINGIYIYIYI